MIFEQSKGPKADLPSNMKAKIFLDPYQSKYIILNIDHQYIKCYADKKNKFLTINAYGCQ